MSVLVSAAWHGEAEWCVRVCFGVDDLSQRSLVVFAERSGDLRAYTARVDADVGLQVALSCACEDDGAAGVVLVGHR